MMSSALQSTLALKSPLTLPCGVVLKNRLAKSAMSDSLGDGQGNPTLAQARLYERWAEGGAGLSFIGEVQIDRRFPEKPGNLVLAEGADQLALNALAKRGRLRVRNCGCSSDMPGRCLIRRLASPKGHHP